MTGEVKKLPKAIAVLCRRDSHDVQTLPDQQQQREGKGAEELQILEIVEWKILFSSRPEPVSD